jgi:hypothetical protein
VATDRREAPALGNARSALHGLQQLGPSTNRVLHLGNDASVIIPLGESFLGGSVVYPDVSGNNYLTATAQGLGRLADDNTAGNYVGDDGNALQVAFVDGGAPLAGTVSAAWAGSTLTITKGDNNGSGPYFEDLATAIATATGLDQALHMAVSVTYHADAAGTHFMDDAPARSFYLNNGSDPVNFGQGLTVGAGVLGCVKVGIADTAAALGVEGQWLEVSVDGGEWQRFVLSGAITTVALAGLVGATASIDAVFPSHSVAAGDTGASSVDVLRIVSLGGTTRDTSIALRASNSIVFEKLFGGSYAGSESYAVAALSPVFDVNGRIHELTLSSTEINTQAAIPMEQGLVQGSTVFQLTNAKVGGAIFIPISDPALLSMVDAGALDLVISMPAPLLTDTLTVTWQGITLTALVAALNGAGAGLAKNAILDSYMMFAEATINGVSYLVLHSITDTAGQQFELTEVGTAASIFAIDNTLFDTYATNVSGVDAVITDAGTNFALRVESISNSLSNCVLPAGLSPTSYVDLTGMCLSAASSFDYQARDIQLSLQGSVAGFAATLYAVSGTTTLGVDYRRGAPNISGALHTYENYLFSGGHEALVAGDMLYDNGSVLGRIVGIEDHVVGGNTYSGAVLVLSEYSVQAGAELTSWYSRSYKLDEDSPPMAAEVVPYDAVELFVVKAGAVRDAAGFAILGALNPVYIGYKALRLDASASGSDPVLWSFNSLAEVDALFGPISPENPLAFALSIAFANNVTTNIQALGIDEVTADAPYGTYESHQRALEFLETKDAYVLAPLTTDQQIAGLYKVHVEAMSTASEHRWRTAIATFDMPTEKTPLLAFSGVATAESVGGSKYNLEFTEVGVNLALALNGLIGADGVAIVGGIGEVYSPAQGIYLDFGGDAYRYRVSALVSASTIQIDLTDAFNPGSGPGSDGNDDAFYNLGSEYLAVFPADGDTTSVNIRQGALDKTTSTGRGLICQALSDMGTGLGSRRMWALQPELLVTSYAGQDVIVPGFYAAAALAAVIASTDPEKNLTGYVLQGFSRVLGSSDVFVERGQMALAAGGGICWLIQDSTNGPVIIRHALTTDLSDADTRQPGVTRQVDFMSNLIYRIGTGFMVGKNLTGNTMDLLSLALGSLQQKYSGEGNRVQGFEIISLQASPTERGRIEVVVRVTPWDALDGIDVELQF